MITKTWMKETFSSLHIRDFRILFFGQGLSTIGTIMQSVAQVWLVLTLTHSGTALGLVMALQYLPILLLSPVGGMIVDHYPKKRILFITQSLFGFFALILGLLVITGQVRLWMVYVLAFLFGLVTAVDNPAAKTFILEIVGKKDLRNAVTLNNISFNLARVLGSAIGGILIATIGIASCFFVNAASYIAVLVSLGMLSTMDLKASLKPRVRGQLREGIRYVRTHPTIFPLLVMMIIIGTLTYEFQVSLPLLAEFTFHGGANSYAALLTSLSIGAVIGGLWSANSKRTSVRYLILLSVLFGILVGITALMPSLLLAMIALFLTGIVSINFMSLASTILQLESSLEMQGRVMAFWSIAFLGSTAIGGPVIGWIGEHAGPRWGLAVGGAAAIIAAIIGTILYRRSKLRDPTKI